MTYTIKGDCGKKRKYLRNKGLIEFKQFSCMLSAFHASQALIQEMSNSSFHEYCTWECIVWENQKTGKYLEGYQIPEMPNFGNGECHVGTQSSPGRVFPQKIWRKQRLHAKMLHKSPHIYRQLQMLGNQLFSFLFGIELSRIVLSQANTPLQFHWACIAAIVIQWSVKST